MIHIEDVPLMIHIEDVPLMILMLCRLDWDRWLMMGLIGIITGLVGILLHQTIYVIGQVKWRKAEGYFHVCASKAIPASESTNILIIES